MISSYFSEAKLTSLCPSPILRIFSRSGWVCTEHSPFTQHASLQLLLTKKLYFSTSPSSSLPRITGCCFGDLRIPGVSLSTRHQKWFATIWALRLEQTCSFNMFYIKVNWLKWKGRYCSWSLGYLFTSDHIAGYFVLYQKNKASSMGVNACLLAFNTIFLPVYYLKTKWNCNASSTVIITVEPSCIPLTPSEVSQLLDEYLALIPTVGHTHSPPNYLWTVPRQSSVTI